MPQFRLTKKMATDLHLKNLDEPKTDLSPIDDWVVDVIVLKRRKFALVTHVRSLYSLLISYKELGGVSALPRKIGEDLQWWLRSVGLFQEEEKMKALFDNETSFSKTNNRHIIGVMTEVKRAIEVYFDYQRYDLDTVDMMMELINRGIQRDKTGEYIKPEETFLNLFREVN